MQQYSDKQLVEGIRNRDNTVLKYIYSEYYPSIKYLINANHGNDEAAKDIFQDTIVILFTKIRNNELTLNCSFKTFLYAVGKNLWLKQLTAKRRWNMVPIENTEVFANDELEDIEVVDVNDIKKVLYQKHFLDLNEVCQKILTMVFKHRSFKEISDTLGLKNEQYARKRKYRCMQILINNIQEDPNYKIFIEHEI